jgi:hypothetical protein
LTHQGRSLGQRQADLVAALVAGGPTPPGFELARVAATADALLRKRAEEVGSRWPALRAHFGPQWTDEFSRWARNRPPLGSWRDGWEYARDLDTAGRLGRLASAELAATEARYRYDGVTAPRPRRSPTLRIARGAVAMQVGGRVWTFLRRP